LVCIASAMLGTSAFAQERGDASSIVEAEKIPRVVVVGFEDASDEDCNPKFSRYGRCVERVRFVDLESAWDAELAPTELQRAQWRNTARLYGEIWENMAYRWDVGDDPVAEAFIAKDALFFPTTKQQWEGTARDPDASDDTSVYSLPRSTAWYGEDVWVDPRSRVPAVSLSLSDLVARPGSFYPTVRFRKASGLVASDAMVILRGRFAERLAADNKRHPYDIMDGDPESSGPLFEQMYPYQRGLEQEIDEEGVSEVPLRRFTVGGQLKSPSEDADMVGLRTQEFADLLISTGEEGYDSFYEAASGEFDDFYRLVGVQILRFAREEYTHTHLRVLTALMAMHSPPRYAAGSLTSGSDLVAAAAGQTDPDAFVGEFEGFASSDGFAINFRDLPDELVNKHIVDFPEWNNPSESFRRDLLESIVTQLEEHLRDGIRQNMDRYLFPALDDASIDAWIKNNSFPAREQIVARYFKRLALDLMVSRLDEETKEQIEAEILLDHMNVLIREQLGGPTSEPATPGELEERAAGAWLTVLSTHGLYPDQIQERPGVVNPIAICTTADRRDALEEPSFKPINIDQLVVAPGWLRTAEELLWSAREQLPFVMLDAPGRNPPSVTRLVGLPGDQAIYRVRWQVWSGWHLLWGMEPLAEDDPSAPRRLALRTAALCDDMVLSPPDLVPTLARAALLDGKFRPAVPVRDTGKTKQPRKQRTNDSTATEVDTLVENSDEVADDAETIVDAADGDVDSIREVSGQVLTAFLQSGKKKKKKKLNTRPVSSEVVSYLHDLMITPIRDTVGDKPMLVAVFDHGTPGDRERIWDYKPRTPYTNAQLRMEDGSFLRSSAWAWHMDKMETEEAPVLVAPAYEPTELLATSELKQEWKRRPTSDWNFGGGLAAIPYKYVLSECQELDPSQQVVGTVPVCLPGTQTTKLSEGLSLDLSALSTQWLLDDRRVAVEFGPELRLDILRQGTSLFYNNPNPAGQAITFPLAFRIQGGILVGMRFAPDPAPLWRRRGRRLPWGAPLPDGSSFLGRTQFGVRLGFLLGAEFGGLTGSAEGEFWVGWSVRSHRGPNASFTPYHPNIVIGPYIRAGYSFPLSVNRTRSEKLVESLTTLVGIRAQFRLTQQPEAPALEAP
jgi:hypothetical protein